MLVFHSAWLPPHTYGGVLYRPSNSVVAEVENIHWCDARCLCGTHIIATYLSSQGPLKAVRAIQIPEEIELGAVAEPGKS